MPDMTCEEVIDWWRNLASVGSFFYEGPKSFPGEIFQVYFDWEDRDSNKFCLVKEGEGLELHQTSEFIEVPEGAWYMHLHTDNDSILIIDDEERVHHAGHVTDEEYFSEDYKQSLEAEEIWNKALGKQMEELYNQLNSESEEE